MSVDRFYFVLMYERLNFRSNVEINKFQNVPVKIRFHVNCFIQINVHMNEM